MRAIQTGQGRIGSEEAIGLLFLFMKGAFTIKSTDVGSRNQPLIQKNNRCVIFWKYPSAQAQRLKCVQSRLGTRSDYAVIQLLSNGGGIGIPTRAYDNAKVAKNKPTSKTTNKQR